eukprot:3044260-Prymnesium_polylepis.1
MVNRSLTCCPPSMLISPKCPFVIPFAAVLRGTYLVRLETTRSKARPSGANPTERYSRVGEAP